jgi:hypothetical protein
VLMNTHVYKREADQIPGPNDPAGLIGVDENGQVPAFEGEVVDEVANVDLAEGQESGDSEDDSMEIDEELSSDFNDQSGDIEMQHSHVNMVVMDGIVMGPKHCAYANCTNDLISYKDGVFCRDHERICGKLCRVQTCQNPKTDRTQTCIQHSNIWCSHVVRFGHSSLLGIRRLLQRSEEERLPWLPASTCNLQPHDQPAQAPATGLQQKTYFVHLVVLSLHGQSLPKLNHPHIFWTFWIEFIQTQTQGQIMFTLIKHVLSFFILLQVNGGIFGGIQHDLLLIHTIISTIEQQIIFVASTAILHH